MQKLTERLKKLGIDWNGYLEKEIAIDEVEKELNMKLDLNKGQSNEYGSLDVTITLIDEDEDELYLTLEIRNNVITHSYIRY